MLLPFSFEKGEKVEFYSFLPLRSGQAERKSACCEHWALLCPFLPTGPLALGSPQSCCGHIQAWGKAQGLGAQPLPAANVG